MGQTNLLIEAKYFQEYMLIIFISYEFVRVYKPNSKMQETAPCNMAGTDTEK